MSAKPHLCRLPIRPPEWRCSRINAAAGFTLLCFPTFGDESSDNKSNVQPCSHQTLQPAADWDEARGEGSITQSHNETTAQPMDVLVSVPGCLLSFSLYLLARF